MTEATSTSVTGPYVTTASGKLAIAYHARIVTMSSEAHTSYRSEATCICGHRESNNFDSYAGAHDNLEAMIQAARTCVRSMSA